MAIFFPPLLQTHQMQESVVYQNTLSLSLVSPMLPMKVCVSHFNYRYL